MFFRIVFTILGETGIMFILLVQILSETAEQLVDRACTCIRDKVGNYDDFHLHE